MRKRPSRLEPRLDLKAAEGSVQKTARKHQKQLQNRKRGRESDSACIFSLIGSFDDYDGLQLLSDQPTEI
eukprot:12483642-Alexandrium_andersonii.AAC.1